MQAHEVSSGLLNDGGARAQKAKLQDFLDERRLVKKRPPQKVRSAATVPHAQTV